MLNGKSRHYKMNTMDWSKLNPLQVGKYGEYFAKMEFTKEGFDVYSSEIDNKGIDFVVRKNANEYFDIQVKTTRRYARIYEDKSNEFKPRKNLFLVIVLLLDSAEPDILLIPSLKLKYGKFEGGNSKPDYYISIKKTNITKLLEIYEFSKYKFEKWVR
jgi:hypothetical protein